MDVAQAAASLPERLLAFGVVPQEEPEEPPVSGAVSGAVLTCQRLGRFRVGFFFPKMTYKKSIRKQ